MRFTTINRNKSFIFLFLFLLTIKDFVFSEVEKEFSFIEPHAKVLELSHASEPMTFDMFLDTALVFSGIEYNKINIVKSRLLKDLEKLKNTGFARKAEELLIYLHERYLKRYSEKQTRIDVVVESGIYNCVSSAVLYMIFAKYFGFDVKGIRTSDHAFCSVHVGGKSVDVETTSRYGYDPGKKKEFKDEFGKITGYVYVPPSNYGKREEIGEKAMLGLILFNRNAFLSEARRFKEALKVAADAYAYLRNKESLDRLVVSINNVASLYGINNRNEKGIEFLYAVSKVYNNKKILAGIYETHRKLLHNLIIDSVNSNKFEYSLIVLESEEAKEYLAKNDRKNLLVYLYQHWANYTARISKEGNYQKAVGIVEGGIKKIGRDKRLLKIYEVYVHNAFTNYVRKNDLKNAKEYLVEKIKLYSNSQILNSDLRYIESQ